MSTLLRQVGLVSEVKETTFSELAKVSAALQKQVMRDFAPLWEIQATVDAFANLEDVPIGYWPIIVQSDIGFNAAGIHLDKEGQPFSLVQYEARSSPRRGGADVWLVPPHRHGVHAESSGASGMNRLAPAGRLAS
jgi:hypothetical protein